jgi:NAD(P)-dependent dehydrogenase (short-subunit alcohol dehydrogenase family)
MGRLDGKVAIVTGGAKGLGKAFCFGLAKEGATVVMAVHRFDEESTKAAKEIEAKGGYALEVDVTKEDDTVRMAEETVKKFGRIDMLPFTMGWAESRFMRLRLKNGTVHWMSVPRVPGCALEQCSPR